MLDATSEAPCDDEGQRRLFLCKGKIVKRECHERGAAIAHREIGNKTSQQSGTHLLSKYRCNNPRRSRLFSETSTGGDTRRALSADWVVCASMSGQKGAGCVYILAD